MLKVLTKTKISIGHCFTVDVWMWLLLDRSFTTNNCGKSAIKPRPLQAATPWFGRVLMGQYFLAVLYMV